MSNNNKKTRVKQDDANKNAFETEDEFTRVPNFIVDEIFPKLNPYTALLLNFIVRKTLGWNKPTDAISYSQMCKALGTKSKDIISASLKELQGLQPLGDGVTCKVGIPLILVVKPGNRETNVYSVNAALTRDDVRNGLQKHNGVVSIYLAKKRGLSAESGLPVSDIDVDNLDYDTGEIGTTHGIESGQPVVQIVPQSDEIKGSNLDTQNTVIKDNAKEKIKEKEKQTTTETSNPSTTNKVNILNWDVEYSKFLLSCPEPAHYKSWKFEQYREDVLELARAYALQNDLDGGEDGPYVNDLGDDLCDNYTPGEIMRAVSDLKGQWAAGRKAQHKELFDNFLQKGEVDFVEKVNAEITKKNPDHDILYWFEAAIMALREESNAPTDSADSDAN